MKLNDLISGSKDNEFNREALRIFHDQAQNNPVYCKYLEFLQFDHNSVQNIEQIPFLPISFYKSHTVKTGQWQVEKVFRSSTTTSGTPSEHHIRDIEFYKKICQSSFRTALQKEASEYVWIGLLPSYLERQDASLVYMVTHFMETSKHQSEPLFFLHDFENLYEKLEQYKKREVPVILIGVTFALLDFAAQYRGEFPNLTILETGGMKGRGEEPLREEIHAILREKFQPGSIGSEYGMTELMSQAYLVDAEYFTPAKTMKVLPRDMTDPLQMGKYGKSVCLNIIDLGNRDSCSFIATDDIGVVLSNEKFRVLGRLDYADVRGCSLMYV